MKVFDRTLAVGILVATLFLAGCQTTSPTIISTQYKVMQVPAYFYKCPTNGLDGVDPNKLTNNQVARILVILRKDNLTCAQSLAAIKKYLADAEATIQ